MLKESREVRSGAGDLKYLKANCEVVMPTALDSESSSRVELSSPEGRCLHCGGLIVEQRETLEGYSCRVRKCFNCGRIPAGGMVVKNPEIESVRRPEEKESLPDLEEGPAAVFAGKKGKGAGDKAESKAVRMPEGGRESDREEFPKVDKVRESTAMTRRARLDLLVGHFGSLGQMGKRYGVSEGSLWMTIYNNRPMGDLLARRTERKLGLPEGWMDESGPVDLVSLFGDPIKPRTHGIKGIVKKPDLNYSEEKDEIRRSPKNRQKRLNLLVEYYGSREDVYRRLRDKFLYGKGLTIATRRTIVDPAKKIGERTARKIEEAVGLPDGWMDESGPVDLKALLEKPQKVSETKTEGADNKDPGLKSKELFESRKSKLALIVDHFGGFGRFVERFPDIKSESVGIVLTGNRVLTEELVRRIEIILGLEKGWFDESNPADLVKIFGESSKIQDKGKEGPEITSPGPEENVRLAVVRVEETIIDPREMSGDLKEILASLSANPRVRRIDVVSIVMSTS